MRIVIEPFPDGLERGVPEAVSRTAIPAMRLVLGRDVLADPFVDPGGRLVDGEALQRGGPRTTLHVTHGGPAGIVHRQLAVRCELADLHEGANRLPEVVDRPFGDMSGDHHVVTL